MSPRRLLLAVAGGLLLATLPFLRYAHFGGEAHANHEPRHGGQLGMVGAHHVELVRRDALLELYVSDPWRRPLRPDRAQVVFDRGAAVPLTWSGHRFVAADVAAAQAVEAVVELADGTHLALSFDVR